jgi:hypothetical protein
MNNKYQLSHVVLYAKGWYKTSDNVWNDLKEILKLDNYTPFSKNDVYSIIVSSIEKVEFNHRFNDLKSVLVGIHPSECWKFGYYTNQNEWVKNYKELPEYDMPTAFIYYVLSSLRFIDNTQWNPKVPKYKKYPKGDNITLRQVIQHFNKSNEVRKRN